MRAKWNLTKSEQRAHSANVERLKFAGLTIGVENAASFEAPRLRIEQSELSVIYAGTGGGIALAICVRLTVLESGITLLDHFEIAIPGCGDVDTFLVQPPQSPLSYRALGWLDLPRDVVLNHIIFSGHPLPCGRVFDGFLVAQSFCSLPSQMIEDGMRIGATICLVDHLGNPYKSAVQLMVDRRVQGGKDARRGDGLYGPAHALGAGQRRVHAQPAGVINKTVRGAEDNAGGTV